MCGLLWSGACDPNPIPLHELQEAMLLWNLTLVTMHHKVFRAANVVVTGSG
jgi:hypothetical protein